MNPNMFFEVSFEIIIINSMGVPKNNIIGLIHWEIEGGWRLRVARHKDQVSLQ